jgi:hypothetical protein
VEEDIADERLQYWIGQSNQSLTSHDAVDVERGLIELRKLEIKDQSWEASLKETEQEVSLAHVEQPANQEAVINEEKFMFSKLGLRMKAFLLLGR